MEQKAKIILACLILFLPLILYSGVRHLKFSLDFSRNEAASSDFVRAQGRQLMLGDTPYLVRGIMPTAFDLNGVKNFYDVGQGVEMLTMVRWLRDFDEMEPEIDAAFGFFAREMGVNTIRVITPFSWQLESDIQYHNVLPWFESNGAINPYYRERLIRLLDIAFRHGIRIQFSLIGDAKKGEWECNIEGAWQRCYDVGVTWETIHQFIATNGSGSLRFIRPDSAKEQFYYTYLESLVPYLKDHPGVFAYEIGNENLLHTYINGPERDGAWYTDQIGSFLHRMITKTRQLDQGHHLIGSGESGFYAKNFWLSEMEWAPMSLEFGVINDIDNLDPNYDTYHLADLVDFIGTHAYNGMITGDHTTMDQVVRSVPGAYTNKPIVFGEFNAYDNVYDNSRPYPASNLALTQYFSVAQNLMQDGIISGFFIFDPIPAVMAPREAWQPSDTIQWNGALHKGLIIGSRKMIGFVLPTASWLFSYGSGQPFNLQLLPHAQALIQYWKSFGTVVTPPARLTGAHDYADCNSVGGWALYPDRSDIAQVSIWVLNGDGSGAQEYAQVAANGSRTDAANGHGFTWSIPESLKDGQVHRIQIYGIDSHYDDPALTGTDRSIQCGSPEPEVLTCVRQQGPVGVNDVQTFTAMGGTGTYTWIATYGTPTSGSGATFQTQYANHGPYSVQVTSGVQSATCAVTIEASNIPGRLSGAHDYANCDSTGGWAMFPDRNDTATVEIWVSGLGKVGTVQADTPRADGVKSFTWSIPESLKDGQPHQLLVYGIDPNYDPEPLLENSDRFIQCGGEQQEEDPVVPTASMNVSPTMIRKGQLVPTTVASATLTWSTSNATTVSIDQGIGTVNASGTRTVSPTSTTTYTLTATGAGGTTVRTVTVNVQKMADIMTNSGPGFDDKVDLRDYNQLISEYGTTGTHTDLNEDGRVSLSDYNILITNFGL